MRTFGVAVALLALATGAQASDWRKVAESSTAGTLLADIDSVKRTDDTVSVWLKWPEYRSKFDPHVASATVRAEFYCAAGEFQMFEMVVIG